MSNYIRITADMTKQERYDTYIDSQTVAVSFECLRSGAPIVPVLKYEDHVEIEVHVDEMIVLPPTAVPLQQRPDLNGYLTVMIPYAEIVDLFYEQSVF